MGREEEGVTQKGHVGGRRGRTRERANGRGVEAERSGGGAGEGGQQPGCIAHGLGPEVDQTHTWRSVPFPSFRLGSAGGQTAP